MGDPLETSTAAASAGRVPPRVAAMLRALMGQMRDDFAGRLTQAIDRTRESLFQAADRSRNPSEQADTMKTVQVLHLEGAQYPDAFFAAMERRLGQLNLPRARREATGSALPSSQWALETARDPEEDPIIVLRGIATPVEAACSLPLYLLGQRFGVMAALPAFSATHLPIGPMALLECAEQTALELFKGRVPKGLFAALFKDHVLPAYPAFADHANDLLDQSGVLPGLTHVLTRKPRVARNPNAHIEVPEVEDGGEEEHAAPEPAPEVSPATLAALANKRARPASAPPAATNAASIAEWLSQPEIMHRTPTGGPQGGGMGHEMGGAIGGGAMGGGMPGTMGGVMGGGMPGAMGAADAGHTGARMPAPPGMAPAARQGASPQTSSGVDFASLRQWLAARRMAGDLPPPPAPNQPTLPAASLDGLIDQLQSQPHTALPSNASRSIKGWQSLLLEEARKHHGPDVQFTRAEQDTFEVLSLLYAGLVREIRSGSSILELLERMQLPVIRVALKDREFFDEETHPARQLVNTIAEADATAYGEHSADPEFEAAVHRAVETVEQEYHGQPDVFERVNNELQGKLQQQIRRAQASEKRQVEAARGRERMVIAKRIAQEKLDELIAANPPPKASEALLRHAWLDAMTLVLLRHGEDSEAWTNQCATTAQMLRIMGGPAPIASPALAEEIESAMRRVGYHEGDAKAVATQLSRSGSMPRAEEEPTPTELSARIKAHARLGEDDAELLAPEEHEQDLPPRNPHEEECYRHIRSLPFGCWLAFVVNQQGDVERRRMSWYSTVTDNALFVNRRGQKIAEMRMDHMARLMAQDQIHVVQREEVRLFDRAMRSAADWLRDKGRKLGAFA